MRDIVCVAVVTASDKSVLTRMSPYVTMSAVMTDPRYTKLITDLGGPAKVAADLNWTRTRVVNWMTRGIPRDMGTRLRLLDLAKSAGVAVDRRWFLETSMVDEAEAA